MVDIWSTGRLMEGEHIKQQALGNQYLFAKNSPRHAVDYGTNWVLNVTTWYQYPVTFRDVSQKSIEHKAPSRETQHTVALLAVIYDCEIFNGEHGFWCIARHRRMPTPALLQRSIDHVKTWLLGLDICFRNHMQ